jgi:hypothetical protein
MSEQRVGGDWQRKGENILDVFWKAFSKKLVQEGRRKEAEGRRDIACTVSFLTFLIWWVISVALY